MEEDKCIECKINPTARVGIVLCSECLKKQNYEDISIGFGMGLDLEDLESEEE